MKIRIALLTIIGLILVGTPVLAVDISGAKYYGVITITNNNTASASGVSVNISGMNTAQMISQGWLNAQASNYDIQSSGSSLASQPGLGTNPWAVFANSIGGNSVDAYTFYTDTVTGGKIRYFPGPSGMAVSDNANMELSNNFTLEVKGYFDTSASAVSSNVIVKPEAIKEYVGAEGKVTLEIPSGTYPQIGSGSRTTGTGTAASFVVTYPSGYQAGDLLLVAASANRTGVTITLTPPSGFNQLYYDPKYTQVASGVWYKVATGSEGASGTWTSSNTTTNSWIAYRILNNTYVGNPVSTNASGQSTVPNPPDLATGWGAVPTLWLAVAGTASAQATPPAGYSNLTSAGTGSYMYVAEKLATALSENPGVYPTSTYWEAGTIGIKGGLNVPVSSGEHTVYSGLNSPYLGESVDTSLILPVTSNLTFNSPLWQAECSISPFTSIDTNAISETVTGAVWSSSGYTFTNNGDRIDNTNTALLKKGKFSAEVWFTPTVSDATQRFIWSDARLSGGVNTYGWSVLVRDGLIKAEVHNNGGMAEVQLSSPYTINNLYQAVFTFDNSTNAMNLYVNGSPVSSNTSNGYSVSTLNNYFGVYANDTGGALGFRGTMHEARYYDKVLTSTEVLQNYNASLWKYNGSTNQIKKSVVVSVPNNANNYILSEAAAMPYVEYAKIYVEGVLRGSWDGTNPYRAYFYDDSGNGNTANVTFRTTSSNANVSAAFSSFSPITQPIAPSFTIGEGPDWFSGNLTVSANFTTGNTTLSYPGKSIITAISTATSTPVQLPSNIIATFLIICASVFMSIILKDNGSLSMMAKFGVSLGGYGICVALGIYDWWMLIFFVIFGWASAMASVQRGGVHI